MHCMMRIVHERHQPWGFGSHHQCQCHGPHHGPHHPPRRFPTKEEVIAQLEEHLKNIRQQAEEVEKQIKEMKESEEKKTESG